MNIERLKEYIKKNCESTLYRHCEDMPYRGNCSAISPEEDKETEDWIANELKNGNDWAWCMVEVVTCFENWFEKSFLGGCSYKSEEDFKRGDYYQDMIDSNIHNIAETIINQRDKLAKIEAGIKEDL